MIAERTDRATNDTAEVRDEEHALSSEDVRVFGGGGAGSAGWGALFRSTN